MQRNLFLRLFRQVQTRLRHLHLVRQNADRRALVDPPITLAEQINRILLILGIGGFSLIGILFQSGWRFPQAFCVSPKTSPPIKAIKSTPNPTPVEFPPTPQTKTSQPSRS